MNSLTKARAAAETLLLWGDQRTGGEVLWQGGGCWADQPQIITAQCALHSICQRNREGLPEEQQIDLLGS